MAGTSGKVFQELVKEPDELAQSFDMSCLQERCWHQLVQHAFSMDPA